MPPPETSSTPARVRTRRGCLTCRKRRRKCDEKKPRCQNCIGRGLDCRYGLQLTFHATNLSILAPLEAEALQETTPRIYKQLKFVDGLSETEKDIGNNTNQNEAAAFSEVVPDAISEASNVDRVGVTQSSVNSSVLTPGQLQHQNRLDPPHDDDSHVGNFDDPGGNNYHEEGYSQPSVQPGVYPSSVVHPSATPASNVQERTTHADRFDCPPLVLDQIPLQRSNQSGSNLVHVTDFGTNWPAGMSPETLRSRAQNRDTLQNQPFSVDNANELLKLYIDEVAPRLDICTPRSSFLIHVPVLARSYNPLFQAILALAVLQKCVSMPPEYADQARSADLAELALASMGSDIYSIRDGPVATYTLLMIRELFAAQLPNWERVLKERVNLLNSLGIDRSSNGYCASTLWATLRFDLALAILSSKPLSIPVEKWQPKSMLIADDMDISSGEQNKVSEWTQQSILSCSQAAQLCFSAGMSAITNDHSTTSTWTYIWESTQSWLETLPQAMHPIFTSPISANRSALSNFFPLILHTSRSHMYADVMHHTTSMLLLQVKPPRARSSMRLKNPTWHAVRICGICMGNDFQWSYDPTILAALIYAGRFISYGEQKNELVKLLRRLVRESGWQLGSAIDEMTDRWREDSASHFTALESPSGMLPT